jgi:hypothetical protein
MDRAALSQSISERVVPILEEVGVEGFILFGYRADADGKLQRFTAFQIGKNPAIEDALSKWAGAISMWAAPPSEFGPPPDAEKPPG